MNPDAAAALIAGPAFRPLTFSAVAHTAIGTPGGFVLHIRAGDPANRRVGALAVVLIAASVGSTSAFGS